MRRALALCGLLAAGCGAGEAPTRIAVRLETDMVQGRELGSVDVALYREGVSTPFLMRTFDLNGPYALPGDVLVTSRDPADERRLIIRATANVSAGTSFTQRAITRFERGRLLYLQVFLARRCINTLCAAGYTCGITGCEPEVRAGTAGPLPLDGATPEDAAPDVIDAQPPGPEVGVDAQTVDAVAVDAVVVDAVAVDAVDASTVDAPVDVGTDVPVDVGMDVPVDVGMDVPVDVGVDVPVDLGTDVPVDTGMDAAIDAGVDVPIDTGPDVSPDTGPDVVAPDLACAAGLTRCGASCVNVTTDVTNCGQCDRACAAPVSNGSVRCLAGACDTRCAGGFHPCGSDCLPDTAVASCGARCEPCATPANATSPQCTAGGCTFTCNAGFAEVGGVCVPAPPRAISPLSTATTTSRSPRLTWTSPAGVGAHLEVCSEPTCMASPLVEEADVTVASSYAIPFALTAGRYYWRMHGLAGGVRGTVPSPTWSFVVRARDAAVQSSWGTIPDVDGDGFADVLVGIGNSSVRVYRGRAGGATLIPGQLIDRPSDYSNYGFLVSSAGDSDGDGDVDFVTTSWGGGFRLSWLRNDVGTLAHVAFPSGGSASPNELVAAGDYNGDGYGDVVYAWTTSSPTTTQYRVLAGSALGLTSTVLLNSAVVLAADASKRAAPCDYNGDGLADIALVDGGRDRTVVFLGSSGTLPTSPDVFLTGESGSIGAGDVNGDGYCDLVTAVSTTSSGGTMLRVHLGDSVPFMDPVMIVSSAATGYETGLVSAGDLDNDGYDDIIVARNTRGGSFNFATHLGGASGLRTAASGAGIFSEAGQTYGAVGDVDGDRLLDIGFSQRNSTPGRLGYRPWTSGGGFGAAVNTSVEAVVSIGSR